MKIKVICISDSDKHFIHAIEEYQKRLGKDLETIILKPEKNGSRDQIIIKETEKIIERLVSIKESHVILLAKEGRHLTTEQFTHIIKKYNTLTFIIG